MSPDHGRGRRVAALMLAAVLSLALFELGALATVDRRVPTSEHWAAIRGALEPGIPLLVGDDWLGPRARMELEAARGPDSVAPPDLRGHDRVAVLGRWSDALQAALEDLPPPREVGRFQAGPLVLTTYELDGGRELDGLVARWDDPGFSVRSGDRSCRRGGPRFQCRRGALTVGSVRLGYAEVDYRPRRCALVDLDEGESVSLEWTDLSLGDRLRGHVGFHDFNGRLRSEGPADLRIWVDGAQVARRTFTDAQGWAPFAIPTTPGHARVRLELQLPVSGTWDDGVYGQRRKRPVCLELRALEDGP